MRPSSGAPHDNCEANVARQLIVRMRPVPSVCAANHENDCAIIAFVGLRAVMEMQKRPKIHSRTALA